jgi:hypothetical protein
LLANSKQYSDERARFALAFWKFGRSQTRRSHQRAKLNTQAKRAVELALAEFPYQLTGRIHAFWNHSVASSIQVREELRRFGCGEIYTPDPVTSRDQCQRRYYTIAALIGSVTAMERTLRVKGES